MTAPARLFVAVWPSSAVRTALTDLAIHETPSMRPVPAPNWHVTLRFLGSADAQQVVDRLSAVELPRVRVTYGPAVMRFERGQTVVPVAGAEPLADVVAAATGDLGDPPRVDFVGHLTVGRRPKRSCGADHAAVIGRRFEAGQTVQSVALVTSDLGGPQPEYRTVATFPTC